MRTDRADAAHWRARPHRGRFATIAAVGGALALLPLYGCASFLKSSSKTTRPRPATPASSPTTKPAELTGTPADRLAELIGDQSAPSGVSRSTRDDVGHPLDTLKVIAGPRGTYLGIYHYQVGDLFTMAIATSSDLTRWHFQVVLATHASQPTIASLSDGAYVVAAEADDHGLVKHASRWLRFWHYPSLTALLGARSDRQFDAGRTLGSPRRGGAEGTPNLYWSTPSELRVGFHYLASPGIDREGVGVLTDFSQWSTQPDTRLDAALIAAGALGKHGDRDCVTVAGRRLVLVEAQDTPGSAWQVYIYDRAARHAQYLPIKTPRSSTSFANPSITVLSKGGGRALVLTLFIPLSGAADTEAGELVRYRPVASSAAVAPCG